MSLITLLEEESLFFPSLRILQALDPYEGVLSKPVMEGFLQDFSDRFGDHEGAEQERRLLVNMPQEATYVSCWHLNDVESAAMWKLYVDGDVGVAVKSTFSRLCRAFDDSKEEVTIGRVEYVDYDAARFSWSHLLGRALHKRASFEHERELRAIVLADKIPGDTKGISVKVHLDSLIEQVFVAPTAQPWMADLVRQVCRKYSLAADVVQSSLNCGPLY